MTDEITIQPIVWMAEKCINDWSNVRIIHDGYMLNKLFRMGIGPDSVFYIQINEKEWTGGPEIFEIIGSQLIWSAVKASPHANGGLDLILTPVYKIISYYLYAVMFFYLGQESDGYRS